MAQYATNFSGYTAGSPPSDWTARWVTSNVTRNVVSDAIGDGGKILQSTSTVDARRLLSWDAVDADGNRDNVEILCKFRTSSITSSDDGFRIHARSSGAAAAETSYFLRLPVSAGTNWALNKYVAGVSTAVGSAVAFTFVVNKLYNVRFRVNGTSLRARVWADGEPEPSAWHVDTTDASIAAAGWVGVGRTDATPTVDFTHFVAATNGDTAAWPTPVDTLARETQEAIETLSNVNSHAIITQLPIEAVSSFVNRAVITQVPIEALSPQLHVVLITQVPIEVLSGDPWPSLSNPNKYRQIQIAC